MERRKAVKGYVVKVISYNLKNKSNNVTFLDFVKKKKIHRVIRMPCNYLPANVIMTWKDCKGQLSNLVIPFFFLLVIKSFSTNAL